MSWYILALLGAIFSAIVHTLFKKNLKSMSSTVMGAGIFLTSGIILLIISIYQGIPEIQPLFYTAIILEPIFVVLGLSFVFSALKSGDLSLAYPMQAFTPLFLLVTSFFVLNELPSLTGLGGIIILVSGLYVLNSNGTSKGIFDPFKEVFRKKEVYYMLIAAFIFSMTISLDKLIVLNSDPIFGAAISCLLIGTIFLTRSRIDKTGTLQTYKKYIPAFLIAGIFLCLEAVTINIAFTMQIAPYVIAIKRTSILFAVLYGTFILEEKYKTRRIIGSLIMVIGTVLIILYG